MKVTHFTTRDFGGGAAKASAMLHQCFLQQGLDHTVMVLEKHSDDVTVIEAEQGSFARKRSRFMMELNGILLSRIYKPWEMCSLGIARDLDVEKHEVVKQSDLISISWVADFLSTQAIAKLLKIGKPVVWTLYDMWAFTGGCHYAQFCEKFKSECTECHQIGRNLPIDIVQSVWQRKKELWNLENLTVVCPSKWLAECVSSSSLLNLVDVRVISTGVDTKLFTPVKINPAREHFGLPKDKQLLLFLANNGFENERKGGDLLKRSLLMLVEKMEVLPDIVLVGCNQLPDALSKYFNAHYPDIHYEQDLAMLYASCDIVSVPSQEENLALTLLESMACGTPCVTFDIGGMPDAIEHMKNGYLAKAFDVEDYADGIAWVLKNESKKTLDDACCQTILDGFTIEKEAEAYLDLYEEKLK